MPALTPRKLTSVHAIACGISSPPHVRALQGKAESPQLVLLDEADLDMCLHVGFLLVGP